MSKNVVDNSKLEFPSIDETQIVFPLYYKNRRGNMYTCLQTEEKFEQLTISEEGNSFRFSIIGGFNEQMKLYQSDVKLMVHAILRMNVVIEAEEYDNVFNSILQGRAEFFTNTQDEEYQYIEQIHPLNQDQLNKYIKHKWKPIQY